MLGDEVQLRKDHRDHVLFVRVAFDTDPDTVHELSDLFEAELRLQAPWIKQYNLLHSHHHDFVAHVCKE